MDNAVSLVQAYLHVNGYFTVTEYPVIEAMRGENYRMATDLDVLAFRFPHAGHALAGDKPGTSKFTTDPQLQCPQDKPDMIIGEVKEGHAELNRGATDAAVLCAALARFGCCPVDHTRDTVKQLLQKGSVTTHTGHQLRMMAFGTSGEGPRHGRYEVMYLDHIIHYLQGYLRQHWSILRHAEFKHPAFSFLVLLEKALEGKQGRDEHGT